LKNHFYHTILQNLNYEIAPGLYERVDTTNILLCFVVGRPRPEYGLPVAVI